MAKKKEITHLNLQLGLFEFLLFKFGFESFEDLQKQFSLREFDSNASDHSIFYTNLVSSIKFSVDDLKQYDSNLINHLQKINQGKKTPIQLKYYQYFSLLFTEFYLHQFFNDRIALKDELNQFLSTSKRSQLKELAEFSEEELNKLAYWNATGSGKTYILHINILQYQYYAKVFNSTFKNLIVLTPSEDLSLQHLDELKLSGIEANLYSENKDSNAVKVIDIHKIRGEASGEGVTVSLSEFDRNNAIFVDEGHKGNKSEDSAWREIRTKLSREGFAFEYSATFGQLTDELLLTEYAKSIVFDYSYGRFYKDGYGKDYWIHNLTDSTLLDNNEQKKYQYLLQNLLLFAQQKIYYTSHHDELIPYEIENPLLIFVGSSVEPKPKSGSISKVQEAENIDVISDVLLVINFLRDFLKKRKVYLNWISELINQGEGALFAEDYSSKLHYLFSELSTPENIYEFCLKTIFNNTTAGEIEFYTFPKADGEIGLKVVGSDYYFALIYIGDASRFKVETEKLGYVFKRDLQSSSLFKMLSDRNSNPINMLIGAKKFIEGWNNYRVSSIGLINFGKSKGSQIIQLFGRGVRLKGKEWSLKRSSGIHGSPKNIGIVECLNIFGLRADYMKQFQEDLEKEGIKTVKRSFNFDVKLSFDLNELKLYTLEKDSNVQKFEDTEIIQLIAKKDIKVNIDLTTKKFMATSLVAIDFKENPTVEVKFDEEMLNIADWNWIKTELLLFKKRIASPKMPNVLIGNVDFKTFLNEIKYDIRADNSFEIKTLSDVERLNKLILQVFKKYLQLFYSRLLRHYEGNHLTVNYLSDKNSNIKNVQWQFEIATSDVDGKEIVGIKQHIIKLKELEDNKTTPLYPNKFNSSDVKYNVWIDEHLYQPLLKDEENQFSKELVTIKPTGLNSGEIAFVDHLKSFIKNLVKTKTGKYKDYDFYLLRNMSRGTGFGFYFLSGGFYPDFMLWIKKKDSDIQFLTFIDPHGLRNETNQWNTEKIQWFKSIKELEKSINNQNLVLNSFILQPYSKSSSGLDGAGLNNWFREDDLLKEINLDVYAAKNHVYAIPRDGNCSGENGYLDKMVTQILDSNPA
jgi:hypothetical protein